MVYGTQYGKFKCKKCGEYVYFNEPDHWYSNETERLKQEYQELLEHMKTCYFEVMEHDE